MEHRAVGDGHGVDGTLVRLWRAGASESESTLVLEHRRSLVTLSVFRDVARKTRAAPTWIAQASFRLGVARSFLSLYSAKGPALCV